MKININGQDKLEIKLNRIVRDFKPQIAAGMRKSMEYVHSQVPRYPPPPPSSSYRRTGTLGRSITTKVRELGQEVVGTIGTNIVYAPYVIDEQRQAWMHKNRWWTLQKVVEGATEGIISIFRELVERLIK